MATNSSQPQSGKVKIDYHSIQSISEIWSIAARHFGEIVALRDPHGEIETSLTYVELNQQLQRLAAGLQALGVKGGDRVALFADNSPRWFLADQGSIMAGAVDVVRSSQAPPEELAYIVQNSGATALLLENLAVWQRLEPLVKDQPLRFVGLLSDETPGVGESPRILNFAQLFQEGAYGTVRAVPQQRQRLATLLYTSGTTGKPKGVMINHGNLIYELNALESVLQPQPGECSLSILPTWHTFGRIVEYFLLSRGCTQVYTNIRHLKQDLQIYRPQFMASVPRLWESLYEGIQKKLKGQSGGQRWLVNTCFDLSQRYIHARRTAQGLNLNSLTPAPAQKWGARVQELGFFPLHRLADKLVYRKIRDALGGNFKVSVSGGGSLANHLEFFFEIVDIDLLVGYGLTETSPVLTARTTQRNLRGSAGQPLPETEIKIVDPQTHQTLPQGSQGLILARGPQIMQGYYQNPAATAKVIDSEGWFDTGDLGWMTANRDLIITGRAKDTIVLTNGENIEPQPLEDACVSSPYIDQLMLVGQDQRSLGALIVPNWDALQQWAMAQNAALQLPAEANVTLNPPPQPAQRWGLDSQPVQDLYQKELFQRVSARPGYRPDERISCFRFVLEPFSIENGLLTQTLKIRRSVVSERYRAMIDGMFC